MFMSMFHLFVIYVVLVVVVLNYISRVVYVQYISVVCYHWLADPLRCALFYHILFHRDNV